LSNAGCALYVARSLLGEGYHDARVLEVGSFDVSGGYRSLVELHGGFSSYTGVDIVEGPGVDQVCDACDVVSCFGEDSFDVVINTDLLEHVRDWRTVVSNLKRVCRPGGVIILTTRSRGCGYHAVPYDFWRFETTDIKEIFADFELMDIEKDPREPGVFAKMRKSLDFVERDLSDYHLYSIVTRSRVKELNNESMRGGRYLLLMAGALLRQFAKWALDDSRTSAGAAFRKQVAAIKLILKLSRL
jgi:SAM-dependent methyltransferase